MNTQQTTQADQSILTRMISIFRKSPTYVKEVELEEKTEAKDRAGLAKEYAAALKVEGADPELQAMIAERDAFAERSKHPKTKRVESRDANAELYRRDAGIKKRQRVYRAKAEALKARLLQCPSWQSALIDQFIAQVSELATRAREIDVRRFNEEYRNDRNGNQFVAAWQSHRPYQVELLQWCDGARSKAKKLLIRALTASELEAELRSIRSTEPKMFASRVVAWKEDPQLVGNSPEAAYRIISR